MRQQRQTPGPRANVRGPQRQPNWSAERILLVCLLAVGLFGLVMTYGSRVTVSHDASALPDSLGSGRVLGGDRGVRTWQRANVRQLRFEAADTVYVGAVMVDSARL